MRYSIEPTGRIYVKYDFYHLLKILVKREATNIVKSFLIVLKNLKQMQ